MISPEQVREFALACGWTEHQPTEIFEYCWVDHHGAKYIYLPDFLTSKDAVIEALEYFCTRNELLYEIRQARDGYWVDLDKYAGSRLGAVKGETLNIAIILAVLSAAKREG